MTLVTRAGTRNGIYVVVRCLGQLNDDSKRGVRFLSESLGKFGTLYVLFGASLSSAR